MGFGQPEVEDLYSPVVAHHHVVGLEIPVGDTLLVGRRDRIRQRNRNIEEATDEESILWEELRKRFSADQLHRDEVKAVGLFDGVDVDDVRVVQRRDGFCLSCDPGPALLALG